VVCVCVCVRDSDMIQAETVQLGDGDELLSLVGFVQKVCLDWL
jgi:hypothetical protein